MDVPLSFAEGAAFPKAPKIMPRYLFHYEPIRPKRLDFAGITDICRLQMGNFGGGVVLESCLVFRSKAAVLR